MAAKFVDGPLHGQELDNEQVGKIAVEIKFFKSGRVFVLVPSLADFDKIMVEDMPLSAISDPTHPYERLRFASGVVEYHAPLNGEYDYVLATDEQ